MLHWLKQPAIFVSLLFVIFGVFVWPTPWENHLHSSVIVRVNRFTGNPTVIRILPASIAPPTTGLAGLDAFLGTTTPQINWGQTIALVAGVAGGVVVLVFAARRYRARKRQPVP